MNNPLNEIIEYLRNFGLAYDDTPINTYNRLRRVLYVLGYDDNATYKDLVYKLVNCNDADRKVLTDKIVNEYKEVRDNERD